MFRLVVFEDGGIVELDRNSGNVPLSALNELIVKQCIETTRVASQAQLRLANGEFTARLVRDAETRTNAALLFPVSLRIPEADRIVADVVRVRQNTAGDSERFAALVDLLLRDMALDAAKPAPGSTNPANKLASRSAAPAAAAPPAESKPKAAKGKKAAKKGKKGRTWDGYEGDDDQVLDYSADTDAGAEAGAAAAPVASLDALDLGSKQKQGFVVKELRDELSEILDAPQAAPAEQFGFLRKFVGGKKLSDADLTSVLAAMEDHLVAKNVAKDVAGAICETVKKDLVGTSTRSWTSVKETVRQSMRRVLERILTPATSNDLLGGVQAVHRRSTAKHDRRPYVVSVVGVNGVGKSTNLGKLAFWLLQNDFKVLVAAGDTFRSGAVEQLKVHVQRLTQTKGGHGEIELFEQGYGKDAAVIAKHAVDYGTKHDFDVVLIDTAGRRHNDDRLMSSLEKFGSMAQPDKIIMVGEALVGTDSIEQARNFDAAFGRSRGLDFFLISKCDTVGEMLGTLVNVTYATGVPVLFVGVGQQYTDLRTLSVDWAVDRLLS